MIIVQLIGGLGNQMFQYATARRISCVNNVPLKLDVSCFNTVSLDIPRKYELHVFSIKEDFASSEEVNKVKGLNRNRVTSLFQRIVSKFPSIDKQSYICEKHFHFDPDILMLKDNVYLEGYWQSEKYFKDIEDIIKKEFAIKIEPDKLNKNFAESIKEAESVSIHVRRGDYISNQETNQYHGICTPEYYYAAIDIMLCKLKKPHFLIFSDDPMWVKENLKIEHSVSYIDHNGIDKGYEDLRLMTLCKHHIIANSSFSWWGAWLCNNKNKIVIAPKRWFNKQNINTKDLIPEQWIRI